MIQYFDDYDLACVDGHSFRLDKKTGYYLSSQKIDGKRKRLHVYIWEKENGAQPKGFSVHHKDHNKRNNEIDNLELLENSEHHKRHSDEPSERERLQRKENVTKYAMPKAKAWHKTEEGAVWHSKHAKETFEQLDVLQYKCGYCGKIFETKHRYGNNQNTFCSNNCKAAYRRKSGVDDIVKKCEGCGAEYVANKYQKTKYCRDCKNRKGYPR